MKKIVIGLFFMCSFVLTGTVYPVNDLHNAVYGNDVVEVLAKINQNALLVSEQDEEGCTPLLRAASFLMIPPTHLDVLDHDKMQECMMRIFDIERFELAQPFFIATAAHELGIDGEDVQRYLRSVRSVWNRAQIIRVLIAHGAQITAVNKWGHTVFHFAARGLPLCLVRFLLRQPHAELVLKKNDGQGREEVVVDGGGQTAVHAAITWGRYDLVHLFHNDYGMPLDTQDKSGSTPLMLAQRNGSVKIVEYLRQQGTTR